LRRAAAGVVTILLDRAWHVDVDALVRIVHRSLEERGATVRLDADATVAAVLPFVLDRVDAVLESEGVAFDLLRVARGARPVDPHAYAELARALARAAAGPTFARVHTAYTRCHRLAAKGAGEAAAALDRRPSSTRPSGPWPGRSRRSGVPSPRRSRPAATTTRSSWQAASGHRSTRSSRRRWSCTRTPACGPTASACSST
jgi:hypothetical protein